MPEIVIAIAAFITIFTSIVGFMISLLAFAIVMYSGKPITFSAAFRLAYSFTVCIAPIIVSLRVLGWL